LSDTYLICDRSRGWAIVELGQTAIYSTDDSATQTIHQISESHMLENLCIATRKGNESTQEESGFSSFTEFETEIFDEPPAKEVFYLSHYGLPEPKFSRPWSRLSLGLFAAAAVCVLAWFISNRRSRAPSAAA
ncbi:hypothetical protein, partial [Roseimaritima sediminicola]|uniref:hypothetical protein n=1 Tax=Roseimaritima sediminicola TaxID=2662066 RepID=UPI0013867456